MYTVWVDGRKIGEIADGAVESFALPQGAHRVQLRIDWCRSRRRSITITPSATTRLVCQSSANRFNAIGYLTLGWWCYIRLREVRANLTY
jgi:hypothetical protein